MQQTPRHFSRFVNSGAWCAMLAAFSLQAAPAITAVVKNPEPAGKYEKLELTVALTATYTNAYDPDQIDLSAQFTAPSGKLWKINGFYNGAVWLIRFAANETGDWKYAVSVKDATGTATGPAGAFTCAASQHHGWVRVAPNQRYLCYDDGTSFYGVGACHAWSVSTNTLDQMQALGFNTYVYWNGTYYFDGGNSLIESRASGLGKYDQAKCARLDNLLDWSEARDIAMILVLLPHDYGCQNMGGWPAKWQLNPYGDIVSCDNYYSDATSWAYQQKQYRYIIARWGYSRGLSSWQTVDEISGTCGWRASQAAANEWTAKIASFFHAHDPFQHPTTASHGNFWDEGNQANDLPNTELYGNSAPSNIVSIVHRLWDGYSKPCIMGETGIDRNSAAVHGKLWSSLAAGIAVTPLLWQFNQGWNASVSAQFPAFNNFIADIHFGGLTHPAQAKVAVPDAGAWGITSDQITFGWITGAIAGKSLQVNGLAGGSYRIEWWDCATGTAISTATAAAASGSITSDIPAASQSDLAYKIIHL
jgi:hypothetical protein